jgi:hypothetical protein
MIIKKFDYSKSKEDIFYKIIYPIYAKEFLYGNNYENFAFTVSANFILNSQQWEYILEHWEEKESILSIETVLTENEKIQNFISDWRNKNNYDPQFINEYNAKFEAEFNHFLNSNDFSEETINLFKINLP